MSEFCKKKWLLLSHLCTWFIAVWNILTKYQFMKWSNFSVPSKSRGPFEQLSANHQSLANLRVLRSFFRVCECRKHSSQNLEYIEEQGHKTRFVLFYTNLVSNKHCNENINFNRNEGSWSLHACMDGLVSSLKILAGQINHRRKWSKAPTWLSQFLRWCINVHTILY